MYVATDGSYSRVARLSSYMDGFTGLRIKQFSRRYSHDLCIYL